MVQYQNLPAAKIADNHEGLRKESKVRIAAWIYTSIQFASMQREILNVGIQRWSCWGMEYNNSKRNSLWRYGLLRFLDHVPAMETLKRALVTQDDEPPAKKASILHGRFFFHQGSTRDARPKVWKNLLSILWQRGPSLTDSWLVQLDQNLVQGKCEEIGKLSQQKYLPARPDGFFFVQWNLKVTMRFWRSDKSCQLGKPGEPERAGFVRPRSHGEKFFIRNGVR